MGRVTIKQFGSVAALGLVMSGVALSTVAAQEAIPTAPRTNESGPPVEPATDTLRLSDRIDRGPDFLPPATPCGGPARTEEGKPDRSPHGEVWAGVGNHGYREAGGAVCVPLGDNSAVTLAVDAGQINGRRH